LIHRCSVKTGCRIVEPPAKHVSAKTSGPSGEHLKYSPVESALSDHRAENNKANTERTLFEKQAHAFTAWKHINAVKFDFASIYQAPCRWLDRALQLFNYFQAPCPGLADA